MSLPESSVSARVSTSPQCQHESARVLSVSTSPQCQHESARVVTRQTGDTTRPISEDHETRQSRTDHSAGDTDVAPGNEILPGWSPVPFLSLSPVPFLSLSPFRFLSLSPVPFLSVCTFFTSNSDINYGSLKKGSKYGLLSTYGFRQQTSKVDIQQKQVVVHNSIVIEFWQW